MQIQNEPSGRDKTRTREVQKKGSGSTSATGASGGFSQIISAGASQIQESLEGLMLSVDECAQQLLSDPNEAQLTRYTQAVRQFIRKAQGQAFSVSKQFDRHNRLYMVVREVDSHLATLTDQVLNQQGKALEMAARIQEIRGILLDMYI